MKALKVIGIILLIVIVLLLVIAIFLPKSANIEGSIVVKAPSNVVFKQVNTMSNWEKWTPFQEDEPEMVITYSGIGVEASQTWIEDGDTGLLVITKSIPYEEITTSVSWDENSKTNGYWKFDDMGDSTKVTWGIQINDLSYPIESYIGLFFGGMMDPYIQKGLKNIKEIAEGIEYYPVVEEVFVDEIKGLAIKDTVLMEDMEMKMGEFFGELMGYTMKKRIQPSGYPFTLYYTWDDNSSFLAAGIQTDKALKGKGRIEPITFGNTNALKSVHMGSYDGLMCTYKALEEYVKEFNKTMSGAPWEEYATDPTTEPDTSKWKTIVYFPID